jgi:hypothetical protein
MLTFLIGLAGAIFLARSRWGASSDDVSTAAVAGFVLPIAGALVGGFGSGNILIAFGADTGSTLADVLVYAWGFAGAMGGVGAAWGLTAWLLDSEPAVAVYRRGRAARRRAAVELEYAGPVAAPAALDAPAAPDPAFAPGPAARALDRDDGVPTGPMMAALASSSGELSGPSVLATIEFPF